MIKKTFSFVLLFLFAFAVWGATDDLSSVYAENKEAILKNKIFQYQEYVLVTGFSKLKGNSQTAKNIARSKAQVNAQSNLVLLRKREVDFSQANTKLDPSLCDRIFQNWALLNAHSITAKNEIIIAEFIDHNLFYAIIAYKNSDIIFAEKTPLTWQRLYTDLTTHPQKVNNLILFEIISENDIDIFLKNNRIYLERQFGANFAKKFIGEDISAEASSANSERTPGSRLPSATASLSELIAYVNKNPNVNEALRLVQKKFIDLHMPRCAAQLEKSLAAPPPTADAAPDSITAPASASVTESSSAFTSN